MESTPTMNKPTYKVTDNDKESFIGILLLNYLLNNNGNIPVLMADEFQVLEPVIIKMHSKGYLEMVGPQFKATSKGKEVLQNFGKRYSEYLKIYDVFCAVDLTEGKFAFAEFFDFDTDEAWKEYLNRDNWEDVRIAVAEFKKLNPIEIVFMSFINENRFDLSRTGWQMDIVAGFIWEEIEKICNSALCVDQINQGDNTVMPDIIKQGAELSINLIKREDELRKQEEEFQAKLEEENRANQAVEEEVVEETTYYSYPVDDYWYGPSYYSPYYDPFYVSPLWVVPLVILW